MTSIKKLGNICKKEKTVHLYNMADEEGCLRQWVGCGGAIYPADGMPCMTMDQLLAVMDIEPEKAEKMATETRCAMPVEMEDMMPEDEQVHIGSVQIVIGEKKIVEIWSDRGGVWLFREEMTAPVKKWDHACIRRQGDNEWVILKNGLYIVAMIRPVECVWTGQAEDARRIAWIMDKIKMETND